MNMEIKNQGKGTRVGGNKVIVRKSSIGQIRVTIPRIFTDILMLQDGDIISFHPSGRDSLILKKERFTVGDIEKLRDEKRVIEEKLK